MNALTDADVIILVLDASGRADAEGNHVLLEDDGIVAIRIIIDLDSQ